MCVCVCVSAMVVLKKCMDYEVKSVRTRSETKKTLSEIVQKDLKIQQLCKKDAMDHSKWRKLIKIKDAAYKDKV